MELYRLKQWGSPGYRELPNKSQFFPVQSYPKAGGSGGQSNYIFVEGRDLEFVRLLNPGLVQQWAIQPLNRCLYIYTQEAVNRILRSYRLKIKAAQKAKDKAEVRRLSKLANRSKAWQWIDSVKWPIVPMAGNLVMVIEFEGKYARLSAIPVGFDFDEVNRVDTPWWVQKVHCGSKRRGVVDTTPKGVFYQPLFSPAGRRGKGQTEIWVLKDTLEKA